MLYVANAVVFLPNLKQFHPVELLHVSEISLQARGQLRKKR